MTGEKEVVITCTLCDGTGRIRDKYLSGLEGFTKKTCTRCQGMKVIRVSKARIPRW